MKFLLLMLLSLTMSHFGYCQNEASKNMPPVEMLPGKGEVKKIYELPGKFDYKVFDSNGNMLAEGNGQFIDYTDYKEGTYFVRFKGKVVRFEK